MDLNVNIIIQRLFKNNNKDKVGKMVEEWVEATLTSSQDQSGITTKLWRITQNKELNGSEREAL